MAVLSPVIARNIVKDMTRQQIARENQIGTGTVSEIIKTIRKKTVGHPAVKDVERERIP